jgi:glycosyltransferase involved in cell wall biosynthesis
MRIGIDLRPLQNNNKFRGIGKYTEYLLIALSKIQSRHSFVFYAERGDLPTDIIERFSESRMIYVASNYVSKVRYIRAFAKPYTLVKPQRKDVDVFLQTDPWGGIPKSVPTVAIFHDLIPFLFKIEEHVILSGLAKLKHSLSKTIADRNYGTMLASYAGAAQIIAVSESSRNDYLTYIDSMPNPEIKVILEALIGGRQNIKSSNDTFEKLNLKDAHYLLFVGGIDLRKNVIQLLYDFNEIHKTSKNIKLLLVGNEFRLKNDLERLGWYKYLDAHKDIKDSIIYAGYVEQSDIIPIFEHARAFVFPSKYEGFGLPILEAMDAGCPVICYDNSSIPEVAGDATIMIPDGQPMAESIIKLLSNEKLRQELIAKGKRQVKKYSWDTSAEQLMSVLAKITC